jgi:hypothetical protein
MLIYGKMGRGIVAEIRGKFPEEFMGFQQRSKRVKGGLNCMEAVLQKLLELRDA